MAADLAELKSMIDGGAARRRGRGESTRPAPATTCGRPSAAPQFDGPLAARPAPRWSRPRSRSASTTAQIHALSVKTDAALTLPVDASSLQTLAAAAVLGRRTLWPWPIQQLKEKVEELIAANPVLLFMKGTPEMPRCGFSMRVVQVLDSIDVEYGAIDVLPALQPLREVTAEISDWQTFPQLYVNGELLGGADIVEEMFESGELAEALGVEQPEVAALRPRHRRSRRRCRSNSGQARRAAVSAASSFTWKEEPQPQAATTFGLLTWKPAPAGLRRSRPRSRRRTAC